MTPVELRAMVERATKVPWYFRSEDGLILDADEYHVLRVAGSPSNPELAASGELAALAPDLASIAADMAEAGARCVRSINKVGGWVGARQAMEDALARFAALGETKAAEPTREGERA
jgi:hypothetical protein